MCWSSNFANSSPKIILRWYWTGVPPKVVSWNEFFWLGSGSRLINVGFNLQCWDYRHFHESESECESLSYESESESTKTQNHESECEFESECHESECESESAKTEDHESEFEKFENLTGMWNLKFGQSYFSMDKRFRRFCKKTFAQRFCKRCTIF